MASNKGEIQNLVVELAEDGPGDPVLQRPVDTVQAVQRRDHVVCRHEPFVFVMVIALGQDRVRMRDGQISRSYKLKQAIDLGQ